MDSIDEVDEGDDAYEYGCDPDDRNFATTQNVTTNTNTNTETQKRIVAIKNDHKQKVVVIDSTE